MGAQSPLTWTRVSNTLVEAKTSSTIIAQYYLVTTLLTVTDAVELLGPLIEKELQDKKNLSIKFYSIK